MNETPEQWAERMLSAAFDDPTGASFAYAELAAVKRKADAYEELRQCFRGDPRMDGSTAYVVPDMVRANAVLNRHDAARPHDLSTDYQPG